ncbi:uncharacterized protein SAPINGB_P006114 [Magnusiomyces paraingens]|uniref:LYC1 C-terminal domain-containing protein n=1 Tax=Magnusiomyces paraingens TaxID=2606893 RepID=A0A5E8C3C2_9ASCO|nr:uncharacterized protein SAPINGB_P006114 [Saprochaete ingens]VVT58254.1 unnamed protein product [Saprochaete ingens]
MTLDFRVCKIEGDAARESHRANHSAWGKGLTVNQYLKREQLLGSQKPCTKGRLAYWVAEELCESGWRVVSTCEILTRPAIYSVGGQQVRSTLSHTVGAVFTPEEHRGHGHAKRMLEYIVNEFDKGLEGEFGSHFKDIIDPDSTVAHEQVAQAFSILWSDIGAYYSMFGYALTSSEQLQVPVDKMVEAPQVEWLGEEDVKAFAERDCANFEAQVQALAQRDGCVRAAIVPSHEVHVMTHARVHYLAPLMRPDLQIPVRRFGAKAGALSMLWTLDFAGDKLAILRVQTKLEEEEENNQKEVVLKDFETLIKAALSEALAWNLGSVVLWAQDVPRNLSGDPLLTLEEMAAAVGWTESGARVLLRDTSWPMVRTLHGYATLGPGPVVFDGRYAWF